MSTVNNNISQLAVYYSTVITLAGWNIRYKAKMSYGRDRKNFGIYTAEEFIASITQPTLLLCCSCTPVT